MEYFGTDFTQAGHFRWQLTSNGMQGRTLKFNDLPFHPEELTNGLANGEIIYYQGGGFTVIGISGSPTDKRPGNKSLFWLKELLTREEIIARIKAFPTAWKIIDAMPFPVILK